MKMKKTIVIALLLISTTINAQEINWLSFEEAVEAQKNNPKKIIIDAYTDWCGWCKKMDKETFRNKDVVNYINKYFYAVKFDAEGNEEISFKGNDFTNPNYDPSKRRGRNSSHQLSQHLNIRSFPTIVYLDEKANLLSPIPGYKTPQELEFFLKTFKTNIYKTLTNKQDWETHYANFKFEFAE